MSASSRSMHDDDLHYFVVRTPDSWTLAPIPATDPVPIEVDDVVTRMRSGAGDHEMRTAASDPQSAPPVGPDEVVAPVWMFVGLAAGGHFIVGAPDGDDVVLDEVDVLILDRLSPTTSPFVLAEHLGIDDLDQVCHRCARLVVAGCARLTGTTAELHGGNGSTAPTSAAPDGDAGSDPDVVDAPHDDSGSDPGAIDAPHDASEAATDTHIDADTGPAPTEPPESDGRDDPTGGVWQSSQLRARIVDAYRLSSKLTPVRDAVDRIRRRRTG